MTNYAYIAWIPLLPLAVFAIVGIGGKKFPRSVAGAAGTVSIAISAALSIIAAHQYFFTDGSRAGVFRKITAFRFEWLSFSPGISIDISAVIDPVSVMMLVIVTFVSLMVHVYSLAYMKGEQRFSTYYAFLSLFTFSMLALVLSGNLFQVYIFWELVGVSSFLLIGYYYEKPSAVAAAKKAFIVTRFADLGFLIGILILAFYGHSLDIETLIARIGDVSSPEFHGIGTAQFLGASALSWGLALVFMGGAGKSAMFPLHVWLPDAMEGPTPVSALIHAATMVVAGVYLVARLFPVFSIDAAVMHLVTYTGAFSALLAAVIACTQTDIKRVLAFSTMSQIGYMMFALGVSGSGADNALGYSASMFHLFTHAFFKSLLFLAAGSVIHFVHTNDMREMGGLRKWMPLTHIVFLIGCLSIAGVPPFSGFFSKEEILMAAYRSDRLVYAVALFTAGLTAFYMFRLYFSVFWKSDREYHPHGEGKFAMQFPLIILAICAISAGFLPFSHFVTADGKPLVTGTEPGFSIAPVAGSVMGIVIAWLLYGRTGDRPGKVARSAGALYRLSVNKFYIDEVYLFITKKIVFPLFGRPAAWADRHIVDGFLNLVAVTTGKISAWSKGVQSGKLQQYTLYFFGGIAALTILLIYIWK